MGGKSRKTGGISKKLIDRIKNADSSKASGNSSPASAPVKKCSGTAQKKPMFDLKAK